MPTVFLLDMDSLRARLRLSGAVQADTTTLLDSALNRVRVGFYTRLGKARVDQIRAFTHTVSGSDDDILRTLAEETEARWVRALLLPDIPTLFMDTAGQTQQVWNEEGLTRNLGMRDKDDLIKNIMEEVEAALSLLGGTTTDGSGMNVSCVGPAEVPPVPGDSVFSPEVQGGCL